MTLCSGASREATVRGAVSRTPSPLLLVIADFGYKKDEERRIHATQTSLFPDSEIPCLPKLRAVEVIPNTHATRAGLWIHPNMEVPEESVITEAYHDPGGQVCSASENLNWWKHSKGELQAMPIHVEAIKVGNRVFALIGQH